MASGGPDLLNELCKELLSCNICLEDFNYDDHSPRILPCYHSFCSSCLDQLIRDGKCKCPNCRVESQVGARVPFDTTRLKVLDAAHVVRSQEGVSCQGCTEGVKATHRCHDCEDFLCEDCSTAHRRVKTSKDHKLIPMHEVLKNPEQLLKTSSKCDRHQDKPLELYCRSCHTVACALCVFTLHRECKEVVEVEKIMDAKKKEMLAVCGKLEDMQKSFQAKAEESEACLQKVRSNLNKAVDKTEDIFSDIISKATERREEVLESLRAVAKSDELVLEEQAATFRSLQAAAQAAAEHGRRIMSLSLFLEILSQGPELERTMSELGEKTAAGVKPAPKYEVGAEKLGQLKVLLREIGRVESTAVSGIQALPVCLPSIQLDASRCGGGCCVGTDLCSLSIQASPQGRSRAPPGVLKGPATCATAALPGTSSYWQVRCKASPNPNIVDGKGLCEFGVAPQQALQAWPGYIVVCVTDKTVLSVVIYISQGQVRASAVYRSQVISEKALCPYNPHSPVDVTLGLLLDTATARMHVIDVGAMQVLGSSDVDLSTPLWPFVHVLPETVSGARVEVEVQSGQQMGMTGDLVRLLQCVLGGT